MWFEVFQQEVGWDLEEHIGYEEDRQSDIPLIANEVKVLREAQGESVGDVDTASEVSIYGS